MSFRPLPLFRARLSALYAPGELRAIALRVMETAFDVPPLDVYADKVRDFSADELSRFENILSRLEKSEPVQYVLGEAPFAGRSFAVEPGVLIPRPETEELVEWVLDDARREGMPRTALDVGTGSGCIAVTLACELPATAVTAWDIAPEALRIAASNARRHGAEVSFEQCDVLRCESVKISPRTFSKNLPAFSKNLPAFFDPLPGLLGGDGAGSEEVAAAPPRRWDLMVSNPPYVCREERQDMERHVRDYEPEGALFVPDDDPLLFYRALAALARVALRPQGSLYVEINRRFGPATAALFRAAGFGRVELRADCFGADRMIRIRR